MDFVDGFGWFNEEFSYDISTSQKSTWLYVQSLLLFLVFHTLDDRIISLRTNYRFRILGLSQ